jgi:hypothetical protein
VLSDLGVLPATGSGLGDALGSFRLGFGYGRDDLFGRGLIGLPRTQQKLEEHGPLELLHGIGDLMARARGGIPLRDDALGMRDTDPQRGRADPAFPDDLFTFQAVAPFRPRLRSVSMRGDCPNLQDMTRYLRAGWGGSR